MSSEISFAREKEHLGLIFVSLISLNIEVKANTGITFRRQSNAAAQLHYPILHSRWPAPTTPPPRNAVGYCTGMASHTYKRLHNWFFFVLPISRKTRDEVMTHDTAPDEYASSGGPSSVGVTVNAANIPTIFDHMLARARKRPEHRRAPNPNA